MDGIENGAPFPRPDRKYQCRADDADDQKPGVGAREFVEHDRRRDVTKDPPQETDAKCGAKDTTQMLFHESTIMKS
jgi:hypothetical protein